MHASLSVNLGAAYGLGLRRFPGGVENGRDVSRSDDVLDSCGGLGRVVSDNKIISPSGSAGRGWFRLAVLFRKSSFRLRKSTSKQCVGFSSRFKSVQSVSFSSCLLDGKLDGKEGAGNKTGSH